MCICVHEGTFVNKMVIFVCNNVLRVIVYK